MAIQIGEKVLSANGSSCAVLQKDGADVEWKTRTQTTMTWQPNSFDPNSNTLDYCFKPTVELLGWVLELEAEVLKLVSENSEAYFGQKIEPEVLKMTFQSALKTSQRGTEHFKCKGRNVQFWDKHSKPTSQYTLWNNWDHFHFVVCAKAVWFSEDRWGIAYDLRHLQSFTADCPF
jgi:hypothetical protein